MNNNFEPCHAETSKWEGGWSDHEADRGGKTNWGITQATLGRFLGRPATADEIRALTKAQAKAVYLKLFWNEVGAEAMPKGVDLCCYDWGVNSGPVRGRNAYAAVRAKLPKPADMVKAICASRRAFFSGIISRSPSQKVFERGWFNRVAGIEAVAYRWALAAQGVAPADIGKTMRDEGKVASQTATKKATQAKTAGGGAVATGSGGAGVIQWNWEGIAFLCVVVGVIGGIAFLAWRAARSENARADAFAKESVNG